MYLYLSILIVNVRLHVSLNPCYYCRVTPEGVGFSLKSKIPITIGTIPLRNMFNQIQQSIPGKLDILKGVKIEIKMIR